MAPDVNIHEVHDHPQFERYGYVYGHPVRTSILVLLNTIMIMVIIIDAKSKKSRFTGMHGILYVYSELNNINVI